MAKPKTPKQLSIKIASLKKQVTHLEAQRKKRLAVVKKKPAKKKVTKRKAVKKRVVKKRPVRKKAVKRKKR